VAAVCAVAFAGRRGRIAGAAACILLGVTVSLSGLWFGAHGSLNVRSVPQGGRGAGSSGADPFVASSTGPTRARLRVPAIGVDAPIESVGIDAGGNMATPSTPKNVAWYRFGPAPGDAGDAVIDGHLDWTNGPAVFSKLGRLTTGDEIIVDVPGRGTRLFAVDGLSTVPYTAHPAGLFATSGPPRLSLITCTGSWDALHRTYAQRLIVDAHLLP
jgi:sortase (surface protein transpeptidase)